MTMRDGDPDIRIRSIGSGTLFFLWLSTVGGLEMILL